MENKELTLKEVHSLLDEMEAICERLKKLNESVKISEPMAQAA